MPHPLWSPNSKTVHTTRMHQFMVDCGFDHYDALYDWSINKPEDFWQKIIHFFSLKIDLNDTPILEHGNDIERAVFMPKATLNFTQNLLRRRDQSVAIHFYGEDQKRSQITFSDLYNQVSQVAQQFQEYGIKPGDRIAGYLPNLPQTVIAMLAASSLGATWCSTSPDFGVPSVIDRFSQIEPTVLITSDGYFYGGKRFSCLERIEPILAGVPSIAHVIVVPYIDEPQNTYLSWETIFKRYTPQEIPFKQLPFNHPLYILFSSGTTGKPKCMIHGAGGTLLQHVKELGLHSDVRKNDRVFYFTTCGWMMWNWIVSALACDASLVLYDGSPMHPHIGYLFDLAEATEMTLFGTSAKYLTSLQKADFKPHQNLTRIRTITSTGSPLPASTFEYVYQNIKSDVNLASVSGGSDIVSCFMLGNPLRPVYAGELQGAGLGMAVQVWDETGQPARSIQGELVCTKPFPSRPLGFWADPSRMRFHEAYFTKYPNIWCHGDFVEHTQHDGFIIYGRSDAVLNPGGVRIGTVELYQQVDKISQVLDCAAIGQNFEDDVRILLFVVLKDGHVLDEELIKHIQNTIRHGATPRHVPAKVIAVPDLPRTKNGKLSEITIREIIHNQPVRNLDALANPESLEFFIKHMGVLQV